MKGKSKSDNKVSEMRISVLENLVKQLEDKVKVLEDLLKKNELDTKDANDRADKALPTFACINCEEKFTSRRALEQHLEDHTVKKEIELKVTSKSCEDCDKTFKLNVDLERHMESHKKPKTFKCKLCDKSFHLKWRLRKHTAGHETEMRYCHYYNNKHKCPFEENGCMFSHSVSPQCWFKESCLNPLCQYRHEISKCTSRSSQDDLFKHVTTSTPVRGNINCNICMQGFPNGRKKSKCEECDKNVCEECAKKTYIEEDPDYFMCVKCQ